MHIDTDKIYYGNYRFILELDTGSETGANQLTVWVAEKVNVDTIPLSHFTTDQLLKALIEPQKQRLSSLFEAEKMACCIPFENEMSQLHGDTIQTIKKGKMKLSGKVKRQVADVRKQMEKNLKEFEKSFAQRELFTLERSWFDRELLQSECRTYENEHCLRNFYFEEANDDTIRDFCFLYALDQSYRQKVLRGETYWAQRNALFVRNLPTLYKASDRERDYDYQARTLFYWLDTHLAAILALPEYQSLREMDCAFQVSANELDPLIRPAVEIFNQVPGVTTKFSCQGVSGKLRFQDRDLLVVSPHEEYASISFAALGYLAHDIIVALLPEFPGIQTSNTYARIALRSTGDNLRFRTEILMLARRLLESVDVDWNTIPEIDGDLTGKFVMQSVPLPQGSSLPAGLLPARLAWLCEPQQIERTLYLLFHLNHWAKARESLLYADRQGLYKVKAALLRKAYTSGLVHPCVYIDGSQSFACDFYFDLASEMAAEIFLSGLSDLCDDLASGTDDSEWNKAASNLFKRITGYEVRNRADVESLNEKQVKTAIHGFLQELVAQARLTRQPIPTNHLAVLYIEPLDLLELQGSRYHFLTCWDDLDESDARKLDPEGFSLVAFQYHSSTAQYTFHLPFRIAETFLPEQLVHELRNTPGTSREDGVFYGRAITDAESQQHPVRVILRELMVDIAAICPHNLIDKQAYISQRPKRYSSWQDDEFGECDDEELEELLP